MSPRECIRAARDALNTAYSHPGITDGRHALMFIAEAVDWQRRALDQMTTAALRGGPMTACSCARPTKVQHRLNTVDWNDGGSYQGYAVYRCDSCGAYWGCRHQYDAGTGADDRWHRFGQVDPFTIERHY